METFITEVSTTRTNIAIASRTASLRSSLASPGALVPDSPVIPGSPLRQSCAFGAPFAPAWPRTQPSDPHRPSPHPPGLVNREPAYGSTSGASRLLLHPPRRAGPQNPPRPEQDAAVSPAPHDQRDRIRPDDQVPAQPPHLLGGRRGRLNLATDGGQISYGRHLPWHRGAFLAVARASGACLDYPGTVDSAHHVSILVQIHHRSLTLPG